MIKIATVNFLDFNICQVFVSSESKSELMDLIDKYNIETTSKEFNEDKTKDDCALSFTITHHVHKKLTIPAILGRKWGIVPISTIPKDYKNKIRLTYYKEIK